MFVGSDEFLHCLYVSAPHVHPAPRACPFVCLSFTKATRRGDLYHNEKSRPAFDGTHPTDCLFVPQGLVLHLVSQATRRY